MIKLNHLGLRVSDRKRASDWYVSTLGLEVEFDLPDAGVTAVRDDADFTLILAEGSEVVADCALYFQVDDVDRFHRSLADRGVTFVHAPQVNSWGYGAALADPDGHAVLLWDERSMESRVAPTDG
jgi:catechol 2,3-dioxygenase-like lactoylglutathione lyase family enzyme